MSCVQFCHTPDALAAQAKDALQAADRAFVLLQTPTTNSSKFGQLMQIAAKQASDLYIGGTGSPGDQTKLRIVILVWAQARPLGEGRS